MECLRHPKCANIKEKCRKPLTSMSTKNIYKFFESIMLPGPLVSLESKLTRSPVKPRHLAAKTCSFKTIMHIQDEISKYTDLIGKKPKVC